MTTQKRKDYMKAYREKNKELLKAKDKEYKANNKEKVIEYNKTYLKSYYESNKDKFKDYYKTIDKTKKAEQNKKYREANKTKIAEQQKQWREANKDKINQQRKDRAKNDPLFKLKTNMRKMMCNAFARKGYKKFSQTEIILGCSYEDFLIYLEGKFENWMSWENKGLYKVGVFNYGWDIDHIIPLHTAETVEDIIKLSHFTNLQPLCSYTNRNIKGNAIL